MQTYIISRHDKLINNRKMQNSQYTTNNILPEDIERRLPNGGSADNVVGGIQFNENNYLNTKLANGEQRRVMSIRILPIDGKFCTEIMTHGMKVPYEVAKSGFKSFMCLGDKRNPNYNPNVPCPLCAKGNELYQASLEAQSRGDLALAKSLMDQAKPFFRKTTYIFRVIDRNQEAQGVKFWRFNGRNDKKDPYNELLSLYDINKQEALRYQGIENYNIFDLYQGRDITLTLNRDTKGKREFTAVSVSVSSYNSPLSQSQEIVEMWLNDPKKWTDVYTHKSAEYLQIISEGLVPKFNPDTQRYEGVAPKAVSTPSAPQMTGGQVGVMNPPQQQYAGVGASIPSQSPVGAQSYQPQQGQPYQQGYMSPQPQHIPQNYPQQAHNQPQQPMMPQGYGEGMNPQSNNGNVYPPVAGQQPNR